ncbi:hypothetical protein [Serratia marcescens]|uniref:hypothetical protein n=1 Tax=Serratia marcescens TaxID=615 RepID=UPI0009A4F378|nr:hypothetical protein [Serratia marcescens]OPJ96494.1 hypothetical protein B1R44_10910 [Serratia marcescens]
MKTIKRFTPDYKMHAVRFEAFAREAEHGELVQFDAHQQVVSALEAELDAMEVRLRNALTSEQEAVQRAHAANQTADALAVENAALKDGFEWLYAIVSSDEVSIPDEKYSAVTNAAAVLSETPATSAALAAIQAQGVEIFADDLHKTAMAMCSVKPDNTTPGAYAGMARSFAKKLREAK